jgi:hypothetical protein
MDVAVVISDAPGVAAGDGEGRLDGHLKAAGANLRDDVIKKALGKTRGGDWRLPVQHRHDPEILGVLELGIQGGHGVPQRIGRGFFG